ncbi:LRR receptor-like kinase family protein [Medicago truncatula]|uniref:LRR receptor-like kinase family protein n=1 Tax=Medicago truncatula TaxID=3880 RepID=A0A072UH91_MEDTR|nr:LRR receptor-like kinase family protein [Medicago truncatula]
MYLLSISNNSISGTIPSSIGMFSNLLALRMVENLLEGEIPIGMFSNMSILEYIDLSQNKLIGSIPDLSSLKNLRLLYLQKNDLSGSIPFELSEGSQLQLLDLRENKLSNSAIFSLNASLSIVPPLNGDMVQEHLQLQFRTKNYEYFYDAKILEMMTGLDLSCNIVTRVIPSELGDMQNHRVLNL